MIVSKNECYVDSIEGSTVWQRIGKAVVIPGR